MLITLFNLITRWLYDCLFKEESPDSPEHQSRVIPGRGNSRESATEKIPPFFGKGEKVR
jgi:hypothetical protein